MIIIGIVIPREISFDFDVHKIRPSFLHSLLTTVQCTGEIPRILNAFSFDTVTACELDILDVRVTQVCSYILTGLMTLARLVANVYEYDPSPLSVKVPLLSR